MQQQYGRLPADDMVSCDHHFTLTYRPTTQVEGIKSPTPLLPTLTKEYDDPNLSDLFNNFSVKKYQGQRRFVLFSTLKAVERN